MLTREQFANNLRSVLEHVGPASQHRDLVGFRGNLLFATDGYTAGIAAMEDDPLDQGPYDPPVEVYLPTKEARDLLRFTRPERVRDRMMRVEILVAPGTEYDPSAAHPRPTCPKDCPWYAHSELELHVGIRPEDENSDDITSEVYSLYPLDYPLINFDSLWRVLKIIRSRSFYTDEFVMSASLQARFKAAEQQFGDRMRWYPAAPTHDRSGQRAIVTVGANFLGAIIGLGEPSENNEIPFGDSTLQDWGL